MLSFVFDSSSIFFITSLMIMPTSSTLSNYSFITHILSLIFLNSSNITSTCFSVLSKNLFVCRTSAPILLTDTLILVIFSMFSFYYLLFTTSTIHYLNTSPNTSFYLSQSKNPLIPLISNTSPGSQTKR